MRGWRIGEFAGIGVFVHWSFLVVPAWVGFSALASGSGLLGSAVVVATILAIFGCVLLHEFGHALAARRFGVRTQSITLYPIGGVARLERIPRNPLHELVIALAGPAVNVAIAAILVLVLQASGGLVQAPESFFGNSLLTNLLIANVALVLFNMLPAFPMDGGRVLRALLAWRMEYGRATRIAANVGQGMALLFAGLGVIWGNLSLLLVAIFVYLAAAQERLAVKLTEQRGVIPLQPGVELICEPRGFPVRNGSQATRAGF